MDIPMLPRVERRALRMHEMMKRIGADPVLVARLRGRRGLFRGTRSLSELRVNRQVPALARSTEIQSTPRVLF